MRQFTAKQWLDRETFKTIVDTPPLVSIDLLVRNADGQILVGKRVNRPAQGYWFVPGGRILKNEPITDAFVRLTEVELGSLWILLRRLILAYTSTSTTTVFLLAVVTI